VVFDQDGNRLGLAHVQVGYAKDDTGNILPGVTDIGVFVDDVGDVEQLRLLIGPSTQVASGPHVTELTPVE
jgi:hypothetical protein